MHMLSTAVVLGSLASGALAAAEFFTLPRAVLLERQQSGSPVYQCHANCGYTIQNATGGTAYCKDPNWLKLLDGCLNCALENNIWKDYGGPVSGVAKACGLDATPKPSGGAGGTTAAQTTQAPSTSAVVVPTTTAANTVSTVESISTSQKSSVAVTTSAPSAAPTTSTIRSNTTSTTGPSTVPTSGGSHIQYTGALVAGLAALLAVGLM